MPRRSIARLKDVELCELVVKTTVNIPLDSSTTDRTHARTGPDTQRAQSHNHTQYSNTRTQPRHTSRSHAHTNLPPHSLSHRHARAHPPGEPSPERSPPTSPPAPPPAASPAAPGAAPLPLPPHLVKLVEAGEARELRLAVSVPRHLPSTLRKICMLSCAAPGVPWQMAQMPKKL